MIDEIWCCMGGMLNGKYILAKAECGMYAQIFGRHMELTLGYFGKLIAIRAEYTYM